MSEPLKISLSVLKNNYHHSVHGGFAPFRLFFSPPQILSFVNAMHGPTGKFFKTLKLSHCEM
jgi:hypothetical protein